MSARACRGCGKPVVFAKDPDGKWQVLDTMAPTWRQVKVDEDGIFIVERAKGVLVSHFSTCAEANRFSATKKEAVAPRSERHFSEPENG